MWKELVIDKCVENSQWNSHFDEKNGPSLTCADCDMKFGKKRELNLHRMKVHSGECPVFLSRLPRKFLKKQSLN